ncbi:dienelactone hydrolase family protein [Thermogemmatispora sp.]|uniref:dienelactone hydrolase family protein n=1 Tax=Thermogemmatispora sp. TaxID=1968838 RepID=UPI001D4B3CDD|nr:dienelactone hydrolase family protein [Thermogemmatispora sp.]MBX5450196.1 dienelactone hydrolase family protein [Thermogemmatispora sp.]
MCYDDKARPPVPEGADGQAQGEDLILTAADGNRFAAYFARPAAPTGAQVIIYPDVRGLHQFYKELALRFADIGIAAIALDYFGRTAGLTARDDSFEFWPHVQQLKLENFLLDVRAALDYLRKHASAEGATFPVGFCMGGSLTILSGCDRSFGFAGLIAFYAGLSRPIAGDGTALERADQLAYPLLGLFGGADQGIPVSQVHELEEKLRRRGLEHTIHIYEGAPHSFFDRRYSEYAEACADAWQRVRDFIAAHSHSQA